MQHSRNGNFGTGLVVVTVAWWTLVGPSAARAQSAASATAQSGIPASIRTNGETTTLPSATAPVPLGLLDVVRTTLRAHPAIAAARAELAARSAEADLARGAFDAKFTSRLSHSRDVTPILPPARSGTEAASTSDVSDFSVGAAVPTMWGTSIVPSAGVSRIHVRAPGALPMAGVGAYQQAHVGVTVTQPLLRGAGRVGAASAVESGRLYRKAAEHDVAHTAQQRVYEALVAYFELVAATQQLRWLRAAEAGAKKLMDDTKVLVESEQRPRSDLRQLEANLSSRSRATAEAENGRIQAVYALGLAMGLSEQETFDFLPTDAFPTVLPAVNGRHAIQQALDTRNDIQAARTAVAATQADLRGAQHNTRPALDLGASVGYAGALDRDGVGPWFLSTVSNVRGVNAGVSLSLELPIRNTAATARRDLRRAQNEQAEIAAAALGRSVPLAVREASEALRISTLALGSAHEAVVQYEQVVADQREKLRAGVGTVIDMVLTEQLLISAQQSLTTNQLRCTAALVRLLFETGALPREESDATNVVRRLSSPGVPSAKQ